MKVLNLDKLSVGPTRQLTIGGKNYPVEEMTVENFITTTKAAENIKETDPLSQQIEETVAMICRSVPTIDKAILGKLSLKQLQVIVSFVRGEDVEGAEASEGAGKPKRKTTPKR